MQLIATFRVVAGHEAQVQGLLAAYTAVVRADAGTVLFEPSTDADDPTQFVVFERYRDEAAFQAHIGAPENRAFNEALTPHLQGEVALQFLDPLPL